MQTKGIDLYLVVKITSLSPVSRITMTTDTVPQSFSTKSEEVISQLSLFSKPPLLVSVANTIVEEIPTTLGSVSLTNLQFTVPASPSLYTDLANTYIYMRVKLVRVDGSDIQATDKGGFCNNILGTIIKSLDMYIKIT